MLGPLFSQNTSPEKTSKRNGWRWFPLFTGVPPRVRVPPPFEPHRHGKVIYGPMGVSQAKGPLKVVGSLVLPFTPSQKGYQLKSTETDMVLLHPFLCGYSGSATSHRLTFHFSQNPILSGGQAFWFPRYSNIWEVSTFWLSPLPSFWFPPLGGVHFIPPLF